MDWSWTTAAGLPTDGARLLTDGIAICADVEAWARDFPSKLFSWSCGSNRLFRYVRTISPNDFIIARLVFVQHADCRWHTGAIIFPCVF